MVTTESHAAVENRRGVLRLLLERYPADHLRDGGRASPRNEFERYVVRYGVEPTPVAGRDLPLRAGDERPGDPMIRHDMTTCVLCTRCVRACEDIQVVGVLDVAQRGEHTEIIVGADGNPEHAGCTWCGECVRVCPTGAIHDIIPMAVRANGGEMVDRMRSKDMPAPDRTVRSVWAGVKPSAALTHLHDKVESAVVRAGLPANGQRFTPHVTLTRPKGITLDNVRQYLEANSLYRAPAFEATHFTLFRSFTGGEGSIYRAESEYDLAGA